MSGADKDLRPVESGRKFPFLLSGARAALLIALLGTALPAFQAIDPFYLRLFEDGEAAFVAGDHAKAVRDLEVAVFGLSADRLRSARSCVYLALSHSALKNTEKSRLLLRRAIGLIGKDDPGSIGLAGGALNAYERLLENLSAEPEAQVEEAAPPAWEKSRETALPPMTKPAVDPAQVKKLEDRLGAEPDNDALRLDLAALYIGQSGHRKAVKLMRDLLKRDPEEIMATYHLSRALYFLKDHRKALEGFHKVIGPASEGKITKDTVLRSTVYITLCLNALGQKKSLDSYLNYLDRNVPLTELRRLIVVEGLERDWGRLKAGSK
jgi:tetratricopeptide (TPR) repeat protein